MPLAESGNRRRAHRQALTLPGRCVSLVLQRDMAKYPKHLRVTPEDSGRRLDQFLASALPEISRARVQQLIDAGQVLVHDSAAKA